MPSPSCLYISPFWTLIPATLNCCPGKVETHIWVFQKVMVLSFCQTGSLGRIPNVDSSRRFLTVFRNKSRSSSSPQAPPFLGIGCEGQNLSGLQLRRQSWFYSLLLYFLLGKGVFSPWELHLLTEPGVLWNQQQKTAKEMEMERKHSFCRLVSKRGHRNRISIVVILFHALLSQWW